MRAHSDYNIPQIPGLPVHPGQIAEQKRLEQLQQLDARVAASNPSLGKISPETLKVLEAMRKLFRTAAPLEETVPAQTGRSSPPNAAENVPAGNQQPSDQRASLQR